MLIRISSYLYIICTLQTYFTTISISMKFKHIYIYFILFIFLTFSACNTESEKSKPQSGDGFKQDFTRITWVDSVINLGKMKMGDTILFRFRFKNTGKLPLVIKTAETSCSCTRVYPVTEAIPPGGEAEIKAVFDTRKSIVGFVRKGILITSNTLPGKKELWYGGEITGHKVIVSSPDK